jgi:ABC-type molybdenum transport system ATPase subunit/photorepair protein PhrA
MGPKDLVLDGLNAYARGVKTGRLSEDRTLPVQSLAQAAGVAELDGTATNVAEEGLQSQATSAESQATDRKNEGEPVIEMQGCKVRYGDKIALGNWSRDTDPGTTEDGLFWTVRRGQRWGVFGPNGSGKTTIVSLLCSDHPQTYSLPIKLFGRSRLPEPGSGVRPLTYWDIQSRIGHSSPEVQRHMPRYLTARQVVESAWADTFLSKPALDDAAREKVDAALRWFRAELRPNAAFQHDDTDDNLAWADEHRFGGLSFTAQRVALFVRSMIKSPDVVVLDEAFSGMDDATRDKCTLFLEHGEGKTFSSGAERAVVESAAVQAGRVRVRGLTERQALICIAHVKEEVPDCVREWMCLPEANTGLPARFGRLAGPLGHDGKRWHEIWGFEA